MNLFELAAKITLEKNAPFLESVDQMAERIKNAMDTFTRLGQVFSDWENTEYPKFVQEILELRTPGYTAEKKKMLIESHELWGKYGWSYNGQTTLGSFNEPPVSQEDADQKMGTYCTLENVHNMVNSLIDAGTAKDDLNEALFCYENEKYKACTMLLFSLIDERLISRKFLGYKDRWKTGGGAINALKEHEKSQMENSVFLFYLMFINLIACLSALFKDTNNFTINCDFVNRNYLDHGMSEKKITNLDGFKVWSALYSFVVLFPKIEGECKCLSK